MKLSTLKEKLISLLRWSQKYTKTDMVYATRAGFWLIIGKIGLSAIAFITMVVFARFLEKDDYGIYQFVVSGLSILAIFSLPGVSTAIVKSIARKKEGTLNLALKQKIKWGGIASLIALGIAGYYFWQGNNLLATSFLLVALFVPLKQSFHVFTAFWIGKKSFDVLTKYQVASAGLGALLLIPTIILTNNILIIIAVFLAAHTFFDWVFYRKTLKQRANDEKDESAIPFGRHLTLMNALQTATIYLDRIIIWHFLGAVPVAIYSFAKQPIDKIRDAFPIIPLSLPKLGERKIDQERKKGIIAKFLKLFALTVPAALLLALIAKPVYGLLLGPYMDSVPYFQVLCATVAISPFLLLISALTAEMQKRALYFVNTGAPIIKIILFLALTPLFGLWGVVIAILITEVLRGLLALYFFWKM